MENKTIKYINKTIVIFNDKLKAFIKQIENNIDLTPLSYDYSNDKYCKYIFECQQKIRDYIIKYQECFDTINNAKLPFLNFREMYSIMVLLLIDDLDDIKYDCYESIWKELHKNNNSGVDDMDDIYNFNNLHWDYVYNLQHNAFKKHIPYTSNEAQKCFCGHHCLIKNIYELTNKNMDKVLLIGCDCILKTGIKTREEMDKISCERKIYNFLSKNDISNIEYIGGTTKKDYKYYQDNYDFVNGDILEDICCDVCEIKTNKIYYFYHDSYCVNIFCKKCSKSFNLIGKHGVCQFCKKKNDDNNGIYCLSCKDVTFCCCCHQTKIITNQWEGWCAECCKKKTRKNREKKN
jgi:hypothetical protein